MSPSPSPVPSANSNTRDVQNPVNQPKLDICDMVSDKCHIAGYKITACVPSLGKGMHILSFFISLPKFDPNPLRFSTNS